MPAATGKRPSFGGMAGVGGKSCGVVPDNVADCARCIAELSSGTGTRCAYQRNPGQSSHAGSTFGAIEGQVRSAEAQPRQALTFYQQTILVSVPETNDPLTGPQTKIEEVAMQRLRVQALRNVARHARLKFDKEVAGNLEVLVAENELFAAELASARVLAERSTQLVAVYQAMGGGWVDIANSVIPRPADLAVTAWPLR